MACNCSNDSRKTTNIRYHRLPRDKKLKKVWLAKISRENVKDTKDTVLCSVSVVRAYQRYRRQGKLEETLQAL